MRTQPKTIYPTPSEWLRHNRKALANFAGEWIAFSSEGVFSHNIMGRIVAKEARETNLDYSIKYVHPLEIPRIVRIVPIRIRSL